MLHIKRVYEQKRVRMSALHEESFISEAEHAFRDLNWVGE